MKTVIQLCFFIFIQAVFAQDLASILENETTPDTDYTIATFKGTRIINGHSIENRKQGVLEFLISHRFGKISDGVDEMFGLDDSNIRIALEYGLTDNIMIGLGRSSFDKAYDGFIKYRVLKQSTGEKNMPLSVSVFGSANIRTLKDYLPEDKPSLQQKTSYVAQILTAKKFNEHFSLQLTPTWVHRNLVNMDADPHDIFAVGIGGRVRITNRLAVNTEYFYTVNPLESIDAKNSFAIALDIETGGHIFQLIFSNANTMIEKTFITETTSDFFKGDIHFGFNISRAFQIKKNKGFNPDTTDH